MRLLFKATSALVLAGGLYSLAQAQITTVTASSISVDGLVSTGTVTFTPVNKAGRPIFFPQRRGGLHGPFAFRCPVHAGALSNCRVPDAALTNPANMLYTIQITDTSSGSGGGRALTLPAVPNISGATWALDTQAPATQGSNAQSVQSAVGAVVPSTCAMPSIYTKTSAPTGLYYCLNGIFVPSVGADDDPITAAEVIAAVSNVPLNNTIIATGADPTGDANTLLGVNAGASLMTGREVTAIGQNACASYTGIAGAAGSPENGLLTCVGSFAGVALTANNGSQDDVFVGQKAGESVTSGSKMVLVGVHTADGYPSIQGSTILGANGLAGGGGSDTSLNDTIIGFFAAATGQGSKQSNVVIGEAAAQNLGTASENTVIGTGAAPSLADANENIFIGPFVAQNATNASANVIVGTGAGFGNGAASGLTTGNGDTWIGDRVARQDGGNQNVDIGQNAGGIGSGSQNVYVGYNAGLMSGQNNTVVGSYAGNAGGGGDGNVFVGIGSGVNMGTGSNVAVGAGAQAAATLSGQFNVLLGTNAQIGANASDAVQLGKGTNSTSDTMQYENVTVADTTGRLYTTFHTPTSSSEACPAGSAWDDANYHYVCVAPNTIKRVALSTF